MAPSRALLQSYDLGFRSFGKRPTAETCPAVVPRVVRLCSVPVALGGHGDSVLHHGDSPWAGLAPSPPPEGSPRHGDTPQAFC